MLIPASTKFSSLWIRCLCVIAAVLLYSAPAYCPAAPPMVVRYYYSANDAVRYDYYAELLNMALKRTEAEYGPYRMERYTASLSSARWNALAIQGKSINVMWSNIGHADLNEKMIPIPIPADRGVHGYRVFLIRAERQAEFSQIKNLAALRHFVMGQGANWGDLKILKHNGIPVVTGTLYENLFPMLEARRFDYFSRSVLEAPLEIASFGSTYPDLKVESSLLLHYQFPVLFFVAKTEPALARRVRSGMEIMVKDGSLKQLFYQYFQKSLADLKLNSRTVLEMENPYLPPFVPVSNRELWFDPLENR
ncbi:hypothetical protein [Rugamonas sp.]|uniref:hypothetical protein n=1 Tax=Rugamonas sp. TaxID=1926287 RepID=UPI0025FEB067|nr:hypothetical protein [Rugamonas sp.]